MTFDLEKTRLAALRAISPLKPADNNTLGADNFLLSAKRTAAGRSLPPYWIVHYLLIELLGFRNLGQFEKVAWSVPVEFDGKAFVVEHRKLGLGVFAANLPEDEADAEAVAKCIARAAIAAAPYFAWQAEEAAKASELNVINRSAELFGRFEFFAGLYAKTMAEAERRKDERIETQTGPNSRTISFPRIQLRREGGHYAISTIESFFSWTEHAFILVAILGG